MRHLCHGTQKSLFMSMPKKKWSSFLRTRSSSQNEATTKARSSANSSWLKISKKLSKSCCVRVHGMRRVNFPDTYANWNFSSGVCCGLENRLQWKCKYFELQTCKVPVDPWIKSNSSRDRRDFPLGMQKKSEQFFWLVFYQFLAENSVVKSFK